MSASTRLEKSLEATVWGIGLPMLVLGCMLCIPRVFAAKEPLTRIAWALVPTVGMAITVVCTAIIMRRGAWRGGAVFERRWVGRYYIEIFAGTVIYIALAVICVPVAFLVKTTTARVLLALAPTVGILAMALAVVRWIRSADEFQRQRLTQAVAFAAAVTAVWTMSYGFLETIGFPRLSMFWVWPIMAAMWGVWSLVHRLLKR
jgi:hypothetical protein